MYVVLSRATTRLNIKILAVPSDEKVVTKGKAKKKPTKDVFTKNIVYKEVLTA